MISRFLLVLMIFLKVFIMINNDEMFLSLLENAYGFYYYPYSLEGSDFGG